MLSEQKNAATPSKSVLYFPFKLITITYAHVWTHCSEPHTNETLAEVYYG